MADYILAHDLGTSGNKATLFRTDGRMVGSCTFPYDVYYDYPLWAEQDADDWWNAVCSSTKKLLSYHHICGSEVCAVSFSGQMMGCLPVDKKGNPLRRAIIWADQRAQKQSEMLREKIDDDRFYHIAGHRNTASYGIQKAMWLKENEPYVYENTYKILNAKDYIVFRLTGKFYTDCSDANSMTCFDLASRKWSQEIIELSGIDGDKFPEIVESTFLVGNVTETAAELTGLSTETKVIMGAGDGVAANVGAGCVEAGKAYCCIGTSAWVAGTSDRPIFDEQRRTVCWAHAVPGLYSPNGTMQYAGGSYKWLKETLCHEEVRMAKKSGTSAYEIINTRIGNCEPGAGGLIFLPHLLGERAPRWNPQAKGVFFGLNALTTWEQIMRSVMEGIIMNLGICFDILNRKGNIKELLLIGGAARNSQWQRGVADIFGCNVLIPQYLEEAGAMGAAVIAGVGSGIYKNFSEINRFIEIQSEVKPDMDVEKIYTPLKRKFEAVYQALEPVMKNDF